MTQVNSTPSQHIVFHDSGVLPASTIDRRFTTLLVLGMHRSGTSVLARVFNLLGVELGSNLLPAAPDNETGFWEHREIQFMHDRIYQDLERDWTNISTLPALWWQRPEIVKWRGQLQEVLQRDFASVALWGIKDPRLCFMLPLWIPLLEEMDCRPKCVLIFRNPQEVVASLQKRDQFAASRTYLLWLRSVIESEKASRGLPRTLTTYEKILGDWQGEVNQIGRVLEIDWPRQPVDIADEVADFIRPGSRHHLVDNGQFLADERVPEQVRRMYAAILAAADSGEVDELSPVVDQIAREMDEAEPLLVAFTRDLEAESRGKVIAKNIEANQLHGRIGQLQQEAVLNAANAASTEAALQALTVALDAEKAAIQTARQQIDELDAERARLAEVERKLSEDLTQRTRELLESENQIQMLNAQISSDKEMMRQKDHLIEAGRLEQIETNRQIAKLTAEHARLRTELEEVYRTRDTLGPSLAKLWKSPLWKWGKPAWILARALGKLDIGLDQLRPLREAKRNADGSWSGSGIPMYFIPTPPLIGWVRLRTKIKSAVPSRAVLYFDTGGAFNQREHLELAPVAGDTEIEKMVALREPTFCLRFDPIQASGEYTIESFSLEPMSRFYFNAAALLRNFWKMVSGTGAHRPSVWIGLKLLFTGNLKLFHQQLVSNVESSTVVSEYDLWRQKNEITEEKRRRMRDTADRWQNPPTISIITPVYNLPEQYLRKCIDSVRNQIYPHWELCLVDDASPKSHVKKVLREYAGKDPRIKVVYQQTNGGISTASNVALQLATGEYVALLDHDDEISEHALFRVAETIVNDRSLDMIYSDEDKLTPAGRRHDPFFKPDWSPEYFLACMYTCHLGVYRTDIVRKLGGWRKEFDGSQDYDLVLRIIAGNPRIHHIPDVLYHWRTLSTSTASGASAKPEAHFRAEAAIQSYIDSIGRKGRVEDGPSVGYHRVRFDIVGEPKVSIVIPSACKLVEFRGRQTWLVLESVSSIRRLSTYRNLEIIVLDDNEMAPELESQLKAFDVRRIPFTEPFNFSRKMNLGCFSAGGTHLVTMNDDVEIISPDWVESMLEYSQWPEVGAVGAKLLFPDETQQHTGVTILEGRPGHPFYHFPHDHPGYFNSSVVHRNWSAVTAACMMTRADVFKSVGGFTEKFPLNYNDVDYCLKVQGEGRRVVYMPYAKMYHHESSTKSGTYAHELEDFRSTWLDRIPRDPYYNPNLTMHVGDFRIG